MKNNQNHSFFLTERKNVALLIFSGFNLVRLVLDDFEPTGFRRYAPRFSKENFPKNLELVHQLTAVAKKRIVRLVN